MQEWIVNHFVLSGTGAIAIIFIISKLIPNKKQAYIFFGAGKKLTDLGRFKLGIAFWRKIRIWLQDALTIALVNGCNGLGYYDLIEEFHEKGSKLDPPREVAGLKWNPESEKIIPYLEGDEVEEENIYKKFGE